MSAHCDLCGAELPSEHGELTRGGAEGQALYRDGKGTIRHSCLTAERASEVGSRSKRPAKDVLEAGDALAKAILSGDNEEALRLLMPSLASEAMKPGSSSLRAKETLLGMLGQLRRSLPEPPLPGQVCRLCGRKDDAPIVITISPESAEFMKEVLGED